jgi:translation initiation factor eIF-2B subunit delta
MIDETVAEIAEMQTHSSSVVAVKAARSLRELITREFPTVDEYLRTLERNSNALCRASTSHASLHNTQNEIVTSVTDAVPDTVAEAQAETERAIERVIDAVESGKRKAAKEAAAQLSDGETLLTHDYSTTVLSAIERATEEGKEFTVYVTEARPRFFGRKMARHLSKFETIETHLVVDSANGHYLPDCDRVVVGMDCIVEDMLYNRVGTYPMATAAADVGVPLTVIGSAAKIIDRAFVFENEYRIASEVMAEPADGFIIDNPSYDATPTRLIDSVITDEGPRDPPGKQ